ncbi:MAG TPA: hypothetical protein VFS94_01205 [Gemmatimonadales bacterium]|nr:hypothetical protein [Gemmatimonadales bacterium]
MLPIPADVAAARRSVADMPGETPRYEKGRSAERSAQALTPSSSRAAVVERARIHGS